MHGDVLLDETKGWFVLSSDVLLQLFCEYLPVAICAFLTDVNGVLDVDKKVDFLLISSPHL
jgi:isopentenyl phosphate kinase